MKKKIIEFLEINLNLKEDLNKLIEKPKIENQGDFSLPCFIFSKKLNKNPKEISKEFEKKLTLKLPLFLNSIKSTGPFLNFYINNEIETKIIIEKILNNKLLEINILKNEKILIEYPSPNTNKSLHIGHVRNILIGNSLINLLKKAGGDIKHINLNNDRGIAVCKSMLGYGLFFKNKTPKMLNLKEDEFISKCYIKFVSEAKKKPELDIEAQNLLVKWENKDKETIKLWKKTINLVYLGYKKTFLDYKLKKIDKTYYESEIYDKGKELILNALKNKIYGFKIDEKGGIYFDFENKTLDKKYLLRGDGTTLYMTQDLYLASIKEKEFNPSKSIFIVGKEQEYHFKVLFKLLEKMKICNFKNNYHFSYGMIYNEEGKPFSSREGNIISADELLEKIILKSKENLLKKENSKTLNNEEIEKRAKIIGYSALSFAFLKINPLDDIKFNLEKSLNMTGETGPYILYTYARIKSLIKKSKLNFKNKDYCLNELNNLDYSLFNEKEISIIKILKTYNEILLDSINKYKISNIANFLIKLSHNYNDFYQNNNILNEKEKIKNIRLILSKIVSIIIKDGLEILDIEVLDEM